MQSASNTIAIDQYLNFLLAKQATVKMLAARIKVVKLLLNNISNRTAPTREDYESAVSNLLTSTPEQLRQEYAMFTHEFYVFWLQDSVNIHLFEQYFCFDIESEKSNLRLNKFSQTLLNHQVSQTYNNQAAYLS